MLLLKPFMLWKIIFDIPILKEIFMMLVVLILVLELVQNKVAKQILIAFGELQHGKHTIRNVASIKPLSLT